MPEQKYGMPGRERGKGMSDNPKLREIREKACADLQEHEGEFDAIVCAGDMHGAAIGAVIAAELNLPLMIVCAKPHDDVISHIVTIGVVDPRMRFLYVDDFMPFGASWNYTSKNAMIQYMNQSRPANIVATYQAATGEYEMLKKDLASRIGTFRYDPNGDMTWAAP